MQGWTRVAVISVNVNPGLGGGGGGQGGCEVMIWIQETLMCSAVRVPPEL